MQEQLALFAFQACLQPSSPDDEIIGAQAGEDVPPGVAFQRYSPRKEESVSCTQQILAEDVVHVPEEKPYQEQGDA